tara:strand:- start:1895 stop:2185 length:291 start_codon:yes stop_codon:yes gene_type:complete
MHSSHKAQRQYVNHAEYCTYIDSKKYITKTFLISLLKQRLLTDIYVKDINIKAEQKTCTNNIVGKKISNYQKDASAKGKAQLSEKDSRRIGKELLC